MNIPKMAVLPLTFKNLAKGMEKLKTQVRMSGCTQRCPGFLLQSCPFPALDPNDVGCPPKGHLQPSDKMLRVLPCSFPAKCS